MNIAILAPFYPYRGGLSQFNARLYTELGKHHEVKAFNFTCLYPNFLFPGKTQYVTEDDNATVIDSYRVLNSINPLTYRKTAKAINKFGADVLIIPYWMSFLAPAFGVICRLLDKKTKVVALVHNVMPHEKRFFDKAFTRFFLGRCDAFLVMSDVVRADLLQLIPNAKVLMSPHPIYDHYNEPIDKIKACAELGIKDDKKNLLFFGLIRKYKGLDLLIEAMSDLDDSYQLIIGGESYEDFSFYRKLIDDSPLRANIATFEQYIPDEMVTILFSAADVLVLPYRSATQSGVVALSYQLETPMVATDVGALGLVVRESGTGIVVPEVSPAAIADGIKTFFSSDSKSEYKEALKKEKARLSWTNFIQSVEQFIANL